MTENDRESRVYVLDFLPHGRADDDRPQYKKPALIHAVGVEDFRLFEGTLAEDEAVAIGDRIDRTDERLTRLRTVGFDELSGGARSELEYAIEEIVDESEERFVDFYNDAQPITLRLHQLDLLDGIGKKLRNGILEERKRRPFASFDDVEERVSGLHDPR